MSQSSDQLDVLRQKVEELCLRLPQSGSKDEAVKVAIQAVETSISVLGLVTDKAEKERTRSRVNQLMNQAERIKKSTDWKREVQAAPASSSPARNGTTSTSSAGKFKQLKPPVDSHPLSSSEERVVLKGGFLNEVKFPPWRGVPSAEDFKRKDGEDLFFDEASELPLSDSQLDVLDDWKRPQDALPPPAWFPETHSETGPVMTFVREMDLVQDAATDCSVVASLCALLARYKRGFPRILSDAFFPRDPETHLPILSENGKYILQMNFNGCYRRVVIDDRIPTSLSSRVMHVVDRNNPGWLWPALVEKAYLKVRGGYDFPGSNSGTDLWVLTGWIPEQVFLQADELEPDRFWKRIFNAFTFGDVLITLGTGKMSSKTEKALGLAGEHDYALLDLREVDGQCLMLIKNPWCQGTSWQGRFHRADSETEELELVASPRDLLNVDDQLSPGTFWMDLDNVLQHFESIYLNWNTGLFKFRRDTHFQWDLTEPVEPGVIKPRGPYASLHQNPQFALTAEKGGTIWVLLWRHFQNFWPEDATPEEIESGRQHIDLAGHISVIAFKSGGQRVLLPDRHIAKPWYVDSPQTLLKLENCEPGVAYTIAPLEQELAPKIQSFSLSAFSNSPLTLAPALPRYPFTTRITAAWTKDSAGGNAQHPTYCDNPQFALNIPAPGPASLRILVESSRPELNVHVKLLHSPGDDSGGAARGSQPLPSQRVHSIRKRDIVVDSRDYRRGCCVAEVPASQPAAADDRTGLLAPGRYTIVCSTFEPQQLAAFTLLVESSVPHTRVALLPRDGAGRVRVPLPPVGFRRGQGRVGIPLVPRRLVNLYVVARHAVGVGNDGGADEDSRRQADGSKNNHNGGTVAPPVDVAGSRSSAGRPEIRLRIEVGRGPERHVLVESAESSAGAVRTGAIDLGLSEIVRRYGVEECWLMLDRVYAGSDGAEEQFHVEVFADQVDGVVCGDWRVMEG